MATLYVAYDLLSTTLNGAITAASPADGGNLAVVSTANFPTGGGVVLVNGSELISYTGVSGNNLTNIDRAHGGTSAAAAPDGATVELVMASDYVNNLRTNLIAEHAAATGVHSGSIVLAASDLPAHGAAQHTDITRRLWVAPVAGAGAAVSAHGNYPTVLLNAATDEALLAFQVPADYVSNGTIEAYVIPTTTGTFDWTINVSFAADGEDEALGSDTTTADGTAATDDQMTGVDVSAAFDGIAAADVVGARFILDVLTTTTEIHVVGLSFEYTANQ